MTVNPTSHRAEAPEPPPTGRRLDESMTLLTSMMERPLDPGYAAAAERRRTDGQPASTGTMTFTVGVAALVVGLLLTLGAVALRAPSTSAAKAKAQLVSQVEGRRAAVDREEANLRNLQAQVDRLRGQALGQTSTSLQTRLSALELASGAEALKGKGLVVVLDNAPGAAGSSADGNPRTSTAKTDGTVYSKDLQVVVNGLWQAGAEAISVNGQRLTSRSAIRFAGEAILVNYRPLARPYTITALGDPDSLQTSFAESSGGAYARALKENYGIRVSIDARSNLTVPAATALTVRDATVPAPRSSSPTSTGSTTTGSTRTDSPSPTSENTP
ncbi:DUF881 domain-containing protein [Pedococcus sp. KACC 23699]|uniref:DUF881 domain-containing protein n=1 Tax=Pedococcus sp. KACC 23699 TaxID=3149228 RepID=A0AAU7JSU4_9MICO